MRETRSIATGWSTALAIAALSSFISVQVPYAAEPTPRYGGTFTVCDLSEEPNIGYPPKMTRPLCIRQSAPAIETLLRYDKEGRLIPWLASEYKETPRANTIALSLRKGVKFHDGTDFNAEAVKWNLEQAIAAKSNGTDKVKRVETPNDSTVIIELSGWDSTFASNLAQFVGMMISPSAYKKNGEDWCIKNPVGTGPFQFVSRQQGVRSTYKKFDSYWQKGKPYLDKVEFVSIQDTLTREFSLKKGEVDYIATYAAKNLAALEKEGFTVLRRRNSAGARTLVPDSRNPASPFSKLKVRQAVQHAVDTSALDKAVYFGEAEPATQQTYRGHWAYNPQVKGYPYNPSLAKKLLAEAGYPNGFKSKITYLSSPENDQLYGAVQGYLRAVGVDVELDATQMGKFGQAIAGAKWEGLWVAPPSGSPDALALLDLQYSGQTKAFSQLEIPAEYLKAVQNGIAATDFKSKQKWTQEAMRQLSDEYCMFLLLVIASEFQVGQPYIHSAGFFQTPNNMQWTPEDVWRSK